MGLMKAAAVKRHHEGKKEEQKTTEKDLKRLSRMLEDGMRI